MIHCWWKSNSETEIQQLQIYLLVLAVTLEAKCDTNIFFGNICRCY